MLIFRRSHYSYTQYMVSSLFRNGHGGHIVYRLSSYSICVLYGLPSFLPSSLPPSLPHSLPSHLKKKLSFPLKFLEAAPSIYNFFDSSLSKFYRASLCTIHLNVTGLRIQSSLFLSLEVHISYMGGEQQPLTPLSNNVTFMQTSNKMPQVSNPQRSVTL